MPAFFVRRDMTGFAQTLASLWKLQNLDHIVSEAGLAIASAEQAVETAGSRVSAAEDVLEKAKSETSELRKQHKEVEQELAKLDSR
ncbi:MAG: hypothetical protein ACYTDT_12345, partial [Planctomycetota bacterium]